MKRLSHRFWLGLVVAGLLSLPLAGCEEKGPAEKAGEKVDEAIEDVGDSLEDAREELEEGLEEVTEGNG